MEDITPTFGSLYDYSSSKGIVIPQTSDIKAKVIEAFNLIFGASICTDENTPTGRLIEAITLLFVNVVGVNAENASFLNPNVAVGAALDNLGGIFGIPRGSQNDYDYRRSILTSQATRSGFAESVRTAILATSTDVNPITRVSVLNNGEADPAVLPNSDTGVTVEPHSLFICVGGGDGDLIASAINSSISAGCAMIQIGFTEENTVTKVITDSETGTSSTITFYRPTEIDIRISATLNTRNYSGPDAAQDAEDSIKAYLGENGFASVITEANIATAIATSGTGLTATSVKIEVKNEFGAWVDAEDDQVSIKPNEFIDPETATYIITL